MAPGKGSQPTATQTAYKKWKEASFRSQLKETDMDSAEEIARLAESYGLSSEFIIRYRNSASAVPKVGRTPAPAGTGTQFSDKSPSQSEKNVRALERIDDDGELGADSTHPFRTEKGTVDLERWWLASSLWQRLIPFMLLIFFICFVAQFGFAIYCFSKVGQEWAEVPDPYVCRTPKCVVTSDSLSECINPEADPCENFYEYACGNYMNADENPDSISRTIRMDRAFAVYSSAQEQVTGAMFKPTGRQSDALIEFYKACIDLKSRKKVGMDPLLKIMRRSIPSAFEEDAAQMTDARCRWWTLEEGVKFATHFWEYELFSFKLMPDHSISLIRPVWMQYYVGPIKKSIDPRYPIKKAEYITKVARTFSKVWERMIQLKLITKEPYPATEAAKYCVLLFDSLINDIYNPNIPGTVFSEADKVSGKGDYEVLLEGVLHNSGFKKKFKIVPATLPLERLAFGNWEQKTGRMITWSNGVLRSALSSPTPAEYWRNLFKALHAFRILLIFNTYSGDILPENWKEYHLHEVFPGRFLQDMQGFIKREYYCLTSTVYYLNIYTRERLSYLESDEHIEDIREKMDELWKNVRWSLSRWYTVKERAGDFDPRTDRITQEFLDVSSEVVMTFPFLNQSDENVKKRVERELSFFDGWTVDPEDYFGSIDSYKLRENQGRLQSWRDGTLVAEEGERFYLDYVLASVHADDFVKYQNKLHFPLLLMEPPYLFNDMPVFDYSGTGLYLARAFLTLWKMNIGDPGNFDIPAGIPKRNPKVRQGRECTALNDDDMLEKTTFERYMMSSGGLGLHTLAFKVAFDMYKNPERFEPLYDRSTGLMAKGVSGSQLIDIRYFENGTQHYDMLTKLPNGKYDRKKIDRYRYIRQSAVLKKLEYTRLIHLEQYNRDQLFYLNSLNALCFSGLDKSAPKYVRRVKLINHVFQQLDEFSQSWNCSRNTYMNPMDNCFVEKD